MAKHAAQSSINGWHPGEISIQRKLGYEKAPGVGEGWRYIYGELTEQQRLFHTSNLHFLPVVTLDAKNRPWCSILTEKTGQIGWIESVLGDHTTLRMKPSVSMGDPFWDNLDGLSREGKEEALIAGIGVEVSTRRRNKLAGKLRNLQRDEHRTVAFDFVVSESTGNCPKYIVLRSLEPHPSIRPTVAHENVEMSSTDRLPANILTFIGTADTAWLGTAYLVDPRTTAKYPSHLGINHRGGRPGWIRVKPTDGRTLVLPDLSGNRFMSSLGNVESTPVASLVIADFRTGDVLYLTGEAENLVGSAAEAIMPMQRALTTIRTTGYRFVKDSLPVRQKPLSANEEVQPSPYSPPVKFLREEIEARGGGESFFVGDTLPFATLEKIDFHSTSIATFTFKPSVPFRIMPGQALILDFKGLFGSPTYRHMSRGKPSLVNDDLVRTWTVSSFHGGELSEADVTVEPMPVQLTMKEKPGGVVTGGLFDLARKLRAREPHLLSDLSSLKLTPKMVGVSGEFFLDVKESSTRLLWGAGGIGITPFITMTRALLATPSPSGNPWDVVLLLSTREPEVLIPLIADALRQSLRDDRTPSTIQVPLRFQLHLFTSATFELDRALPFAIHAHRERLDVAWFQRKDQLLRGREAYVCGPREFEDMVVESLVNLPGYERGTIRRETFAY